MNEEDASSIREYRAGANESSATPNVAASSVVMHLNLPVQETFPCENSHLSDVINYKPNVTLPYAYTEEDHFVVSPEALESNAEESKTTEHLSPVAIDPPTTQTKEEIPEPEECDTDDNYAVRVSTVLRDFDRKSKDGDWPMSTSVACYWCSHDFKTPPVGLPTKWFEKEDGFFVTGCFCSLECAAAYNFDSKESNEVICERHAMLSNLSEILRGSKEVSSAPPWTALHKFGGHMTISQFREYTTAGQILMENVPPMRSLTTQLVEVNEEDVGGGFNYIPIDDKRVERGMQELSLKRKKPISDYKNTLDRTMNVTVSTVRRTQSAQSEPTAV